MPIGEHINRLIAIRLQYDIMGVENIVVCRTDSEAATLITTNVDERDHPFIIGTTNPDNEDLCTLMARAEKQGKSGEALQKIEDDWVAQAGLCLYNDAVAAAIKKKGGNPANFLKKAAHVSNKEARKLAKQEGVEVFWDWDKPRVREGYVVSFFSVGKLKSTDLYGLDFTVTKVAHNALSTVLSRTRHTLTQSGVCLYLFMLKLS